MANKKPKILEDRAARILYLDIENSRMVLEFETYSLYDNNRIHPRHIKHDWYITCAAWGWLDNTKKKVTEYGSVSVADFKTAYKKNFRDDRGVVKALHKVMSQADLIVGHNSDSFDIKKISYKFIKYGLEPLDLCPTVDTLKSAKKYFKSSSNSLFNLAKEFDVPMKIELPPGTMHKADNGCEKSLKKLVAYNKGDITAGASLYFKMLPYIKNHPNLNKILGEKQSPKKITKCGSCGSRRIKKDGNIYTNNARYERYPCLTCGSSTRGKKISNK